MSDQEATEDLREVLTMFWLDMLQEIKAAYPERLKASELLAKYLLGEGKTPVRRGPRRPSTAEILKLAAQMEQEDDGAAGG